MGRLITFVLAVLFASPAYAICPGAVTDCASPTYNALTANTLTVQRQAALGNWATGSEPASPAAGWLGYNSTDNKPEFWNGSAWVELGGGQWTAGAVSTLGSGLTLSSGTLTAQWQAGAVTSLGAGLTLSGGVLSVTGGSSGSCWVGSPATNCFYSTNTGSPWRGAFEAHETSWTPPTTTGGQWSFYHSTFLDSVGLTNRSGSVADQWNASLFGTYVEGHASAALYNSHFVGSGIYTFVPAGLNDGQNGGTFSGGLPGNPNYLEIGGLTAVGEMGSPGDYTENVASYVCDNLGCGTGTGNQSRMTAFLAAVYKNYAGTDYGTSGFIADSLGTQQTTNAPNSILRGLGGWLVGADFSGVTNGGFVALELRGGNAIADDLVGDVYIYAANTQIATFNTTALTLSKPLVFSGTLPTGTAAYAACITSGGEVVVSTASADCFGGGSASVTSFNTRTGAVTLTSADISGASGLVNNGSITTGNIGTLTLTNPLAQNYGGFGVNIAAAGAMPNGALCIGNNAGCIISTLTAGTGISIANGAGTVTITATGAAAASLAVGSSSVTGGSAGYLLYNNGGTLGNEAVSSLTIATSQLSGIVGTANGGLGYNASTAPNGSIPIGNGTGYINSTLTAGSGITITNGAGTITISSSSSFSGGTVTGATTFQSTAQFNSTIYTSSSGSTGTAVSGSATDLSFYKGATLLADFNTSSATFSVSPNTAAGIIYYAQGSPGATCTGSPSSSFATIGGIVTHC